MKKTLDDLMSLLGVCRKRYVSEKELIGLDPTDYYWDEYEQCWMESDKALRERHETTDTRN
jgi:hypothetical protein